MQGYQHGQGLWPGGYDKGVSMIKQSGRAPENTPEWYREKETDSPKMSMVTHALKSLQDMRGGQSGKRPAEGLRGDFSGHGGVPDVKRSRYDSGGPPESMKQDQNDSWRCTKCNSKNIEGRNYCIHCYSSREVAELPSKSHAKVDEEKACTLYVFDLLLTTTTSDLFKYFSQWGGMIDVYVKIRDDGISSGKGLVQYRRREDAQAALAAGPHIIQKKQILVSDKKGGDPWKRRDDMDKHKLYVTNIPLDVTQDELFRYFSQWGTIFSCEIVETERSRTNKIAFVSYTNEGDALKCLQSSHHLRNRELSVRVSVKSKSMIKDAKVPDRRKTAAALASLESHKLLATNVPPDVTEDELFQYFSMWGKLFSCEVIKNKERSRIRNKNSKLAFITYTKEEDALKCLQSRHNLRDRELFVHVSSKSKSMMRAAEDPKKVASAIASLELSLITLFVCNIPTDVTTEQLLEHFAKWGNIYACRIGGHYGRNNNFGYVCYNKKEDAMKSLNEPHILKDQKLFLRVSDTVKPINTDSKVPDRRKTSSLERIKDARVPDRRRIEAASASLERIKDARVPDRRRREAASASLERIKDARVPDQRRREAASATEESPLKIKLYVSYIPAGVTSNELLMHFSKWGIILKCTVEGLIGRDNGYGYVCYNSERDALKCLNEQHYMQGRKLSVRVSDESKFMIENAKDPKKTAAASESPESSQKITLFVSNIPPDLTSDDLLRHFSKHGKVNSCRIVGKIGNKDTKYGFVSFINDKDAFRCLNVTHKLRNNWKLHLRVSDKSKPRDKTAIDTKNMSAVQKKNLNRRLFVNNVSATTTLKEVYDYFVKWGELSYYALRPTATNKLIAFVTYANMEDALQCLNAVHFLNGNYLYVHCVTKETQEPPRASDSHKSDVSRDAPAVPARSPQDAPAIPARSARPSSPRQTSETFPSWREQRHCETVQPQRFPETFKSQRLHEVSHQQDAMEPQRLPEDVSRRMPEHFQSQRLPETFQSRRIPEDIHPQKLPEVYQPRLLPEDVKPRRQSSPEHFVPGLTPADSVSGTPPNIPLGTEYDCNVSGCFYKGTSLQFERHWKERHEAKVVDLICPFCSMGCVDADDFCEHLDFFHGIEDKIEMSKFLQMAKRQERDNIHFVMPGNVTKESCMRVAQPVQHEPTRLKAPPQQKTDAGEFTFTGTMDESLNHWNKNHVSELIHLRCPICPKTFKKEASLKFHIKHVHPTIEMYSEKEPEDPEAYFEESQNFILGSSQNETAFHDLQREVPKSQTHIQTISDVGSRSIHDGNRSTQTKPTASSSPPLQSGQNVPRPNLVPSLPTQQPVHRSDPPPLATHVPLPPLQHIQSQPTIVSALPLMDRDPVPLPTDIPTKQAVPLLGVVTPFYPSASVPNPVPPPPRPSVSTPQLAVASPLHLQAYPQPSDSGIAKTFTQKTVAAASRPVVDTQSHIVPPVSYSQTPFQPQVSAQSQQAPIMAPPQPQVGATVTPSVVPQTFPQAGDPPQLPVTGEVISQSLQHGSAPQPVQPQMSQPEVLMKQPPVDSQSVNMPSADPSTTPPLNPLDLINVYKGSKETQKKSSKDVQKRPSKQEKTSNEPQNEFHTMERLEDANIKLRRRLKADVGEEEEDDKEHEEPKEMLEEFSDNSGQSRKDLQQRTDPHGRTSEDIQQRTDKDSWARDKFQRRTDYGVDTDPKEMLKESLDEESNVNLEVKGALSQAHEDMKARARTIAQKVVGDYRNEQVAGKTTNIHTKAATVSPARNQGLSKEGKIKPGLVDNKVLGQLLMKSIGMVKYQSKRANVDADLIRKGISWAKNEIIDMLKQDEKMTLTETDEGSREAGFQQRTDNHEWSKKEFQQRTDNCPRSRNKFQQRTDNSGQAGGDLQQRADNHSQEGEDCQQRADNHPCLRNRFQLRTDNHGWSSDDLQQRTDYRSHTGEDLQQRTDYRSHTGEDLQQRTDYRSHKGEDLQQRTDYRSRTGEDLQQRADNHGHTGEALQQRADNHGQAGEDLQQWADHRGRTREDVQRRTDKHARSSNKYHQRTDNRGRSREEFQNRRDWNVEKEEHVEVYMDEYGNEDEEYVLAYVDEDGVHVMDDGFVMGEGGPVKKREQMGEETNDMYRAIDQGSRSNRIWEESRSHGQRGYGGGEASGHRILDERDMQIYKRGQEEYIEDDRFSEEEYLEYREDDRISSSSSNHSTRRNEDRRSRRFEEQMPRKSVLDERRQFSPPLSRYSKRREDEYEVFEEVDSYQVSNEHFNEGHGPLIEDRHYIEEDEGYVHNERVNYGMYNEYKEDFDRVRTRSAQQDSTWRGGRLDRDRRFSKQK